MRAARVHWRQFSLQAKGSKDRKPEFNIGATTCIRPSHSIYSHKLQRYLTAAELLGQQGIWASDFLHPDAVKELHTQSTFAREMAGMAFTTTVLQANLLTSIIHCEGWKIVAAEQHGLHVGEPPIPLVAGAAASSRRGGKRRLLDKMVDRSLQQKRDQTATGAERAGRLQTSTSFKNAWPQQRGQSNKCCEQAADHPEIPGIS